MAEEREAPKEIKFADLVVDLSFHPQKDVLAAGLIDGEVKICSYSTTEENHELMTFTHHKKACRCVKFSPSGDQLITTSKDKSLHVIDTSTGAVVRSVQKAHDSPPYSMLVIDENQVATGDDDGTIKLWDRRQDKAIMELKECEEFISDMVIDDQRKILVASSGEGTLTAFHIKKKKMELQSELFESEMLSLAVVKGGSKLLCGDGEGVLNFFNWGQWGNISDRFPGHPMSIDCMVAISDDIVCTGSMDGIVRAVHILPNRFLGSVGQHDEFPVENLSLSRDGTFLASCSHDQKIKFWNITDVKDEKVDISKKAKKSNKPKTLNKAAQKNDFFADLAEPSSSSAAPSAGTEDSGVEDSDLDDDEDDDDDDDE
ncbi:WD repeat-containing protein 55 [Lingula anatina]|uniref:WD repeat-containing protein 55 n=1 Tax=Lingula anatina TaxID=7574 RepID=A0A1S3HX20_LINAN|nr:WD repeat-containing protein 55 [Lingula anatina]|eukprot:XP_013390575.1 WD repeat-containing protein 55 [Lingula anatina]